MSIANSMLRKLPGKALDRLGFAPLAILVLLLAIAGLGAAVLTVSQQTGLVNFAAQNKLTLQGQVNKITPCKNTIICHRLTNSSDGVNHYLVSSRKIGSEKIDLDKYIGKLVEIQGVEVAKQSTNPYILVQSIKELNAGNIISPTSLPVTEFGTIVRSLTPIPLPAPTPIPIPDGNANSGGGSSGTTGPGQQTTTCQYKPSGDPICIQTMVYPDCPNGQVIQPDGKDKCGCPFPPVCQYLSPNPGPPLPVKPPCQFRPCCLDTNPRCLPVTPKEGWCPQPNPACPGPVPVPGYDLRTDDGRIYHLTTVSQPRLCSPGDKLCLTKGTMIDLSGYLGKTVLIEGTMRRDAAYWCPPNPQMGMPCRIAPVAPSWWPLSTGLTFEVQKIQEARRYSTAAVTDLLDNTTGKYQNENVYVFRNKLPCTSEAGFPCPPAPDGQRDLKPGFPKIFVRSSKFDLQPSVNHRIRAGFAVYSVGPQVDIFLDVTQLDIIGPSHSECRGLSCVEIPGAGPNTCANPEDCVPVTPPPPPPTPGEKCTKNSDCNPCRPPRMCAEAMPDTTWSCVKGTCVASNTPQ